MRKRSFIKYFILPALIFLSVGVYAATTVTTPVTVATTTYPAAVNCFLLGPSGPRYVERTPNGNLCVLFNRQNNATGAPGYKTFIFSTDNGLTWSDDITVNTNAFYTSDYRQHDCMTYDSSNNIYTVSQYQDSDSGTTNLRFVKLTWTGSTYVVAKTSNILNSQDGSYNNSPNAWMKSVLVDKNGTIWVFASLNAIPTGYSGYFPYGVIAYKSTDGSTWTLDSSLNTGATTTLSGGISANATSITLATLPASFKATDNPINVGGEWMTFTSFTGSTATSVRRNNGLLGPATMTSNYTILGSDTVIKAGLYTDLTTTRFPSSGTINLDGEKIVYTGLLGNWFTGCTTRTSTASVTLTLKGAIAVGATAVTFTSDANLAGLKSLWGLIRIDNELLSYTTGATGANAISGDGTIIAAVTRGVLVGQVFVGTGGVTITAVAAAAHSDAALVYQGEATPHKAQSVINSVTNVAHSDSETVWQAPYVYAVVPMESTLYNGYPAIFFVQGGTTSNSQYMYYNGSSWSAPAAFWNSTIAYAVKGVTAGAFAFSPLSLDSGEMDAAVWTSADRTVRQLQFTGTTWVSTIIATDATYLASGMLDAALTTNGVDLNCFYVKTNANNNFVICSKFGTKSGGTWTWGTETTIATDTSSVITSNCHNMNTVTYSGKTGYSPVFWSESTFTPFYLKMAKVQSPLLVRSVSPTSAANTAVSSLSVSGLGFFNTNAANKVAAVQLSNGVNFSSWSVSDDLTITNAVLPVGVTPGTYNIVVVDTAGTSATSSAIFTVTGSTYSSPSVAGISPVSGYNVAPVTVTVTGANFMGGVGSAGFTSSVYLSGSGNTYYLSGWSVGSETSITGAVVPSGIPAGLYDVLVTTGAGTTSVSGIQFAVLAGPNVTAITPASGTEGNASTLTLTGSGFFGGTGTSAVTAINLTDGTFTVALSGYTVKSDSVITGAVVPSSAFPSTYNVRISTAGTTSLTSSAKFIVSSYLAAGTGVASVTNSNTLPPLQEKKIILNSDGKIVAFYQQGDSNGGPFCYSVSSDGGSTFGTCYTIGGTTGVYASSVGMYGTAYKDPSSDNIYTLYSTNTGLGGRRGLNIRKMTYSGGTYSLGTEITVVPYTSTSTATLSAASDLAPHANLLKEPGGGKLWVTYTFWTAYQTFVTRTDQLCATYSTDDGATWNGTTSDANQPNHFIVDVGGLPTLLSITPTNLTMLYWNSSPTIAYAGSGPGIYITAFNGSTWVYKGSTGANTTSDYSICATDDNRLHIIWYAGKVINYTCSYNGTYWNVPAEAVSSTVATSCQNPAIASDGVNIWATYVNFVNGTTMTGPSSLVFKKKTFTGWDASETVIYSNSTNLSVPYIMDRVPANASYIPVTVYEGTGSPWNLKFRKIALPPKVSAPGPASVSNTAPSTISVTGSGFFGGQSGSNVYSVKLTDPSNTSLAFSSVSDTVIASVIVPAGVVPGTYNVRVTTGAGSNLTSTTMLGIITTTPVVSNVSPSTGATNAYTTVGITGSGFFGGNSSANVSKIVLSSSPTLVTLSGFTVTSDGNISGAVVAPGAPVGTYNVLVTTGGGANTTSAVQFVVTAGAPVVSYSLPASGQNAYPTTVSIIGAGFFGGLGSNNVSAVQLGTTPATAITSYSVVSDTLITGGIIPAGLTLGSYNILVTTGAGSNITSASQFGVIAPVPVVTSLSVASGANNVTITTNITGLGFFGGVGSNKVSAVTLMTTPSTALSYTSVTNDSTITGVKIPPGFIAGSYVVQVTAAGGSNTTGALFTVTSTTAPTVTAVNPATGDNTAPKTVTITGTGFFAGGSTNAVSAINFAKTTGPTLATITITGYSVASDSQITNVIVPLGFPVDGGGTYDVRVTTSGGSNTTSTQKFVKTTTGQLATYNVGTAASGKPFTSIQSAINQLTYDKNGGAFGLTSTINIYAGTYYETVTTSSSMSLYPQPAYPLIITANTGDTVIIDGQGTAPYSLQIPGQSNIVVQNLQMRNTTSSCVTLSGNAKSITITSNQFSNWGGGVAFTGNNAAFVDYSTTSFSIVVTNNTFTNPSVFTSYGVRYSVVTSGAGNGTHVVANNTFNNCQAYFSLVGSTTVSGNTFYNYNESGTIPLWFGTANPSSTITINNNSIIGPNAYGPTNGMWIVFATAAGNTYNIYNNLIANFLNVQGLVLSNSPGVNVYNNTFSNCGSSAPIPAITAATSSTAATIMNNLIYIQNNNISGISVDATSVPYASVGYNGIIYAGGVTSTNFGTWSGTTVANLGAWVTATSGTTTTGHNNTDTGSVTGSTLLFANTSGTFQSINDYKTLGTAPTKFSAAAVASLFTTDYFGKTRDVKWDIGFYESQDPPVVTAVSPTSAQVSGSTTTVTVSGYGFCGTTGSTSVSAITLNPGSVAISTFSVLSDTSLYATIPAGQAAGTYYFTLTTPVSTYASSTVPYTISQAVPAVTSITPNTGANSAPVTASIVGSGFTGATGLVLAKTSGTGATITITGFNVVDDSHITNIVIPLGYPSDGGGSYDVRVTVTGSQNVTSIQRFVKTSSGALGTYSVGSGKPFTTIQSAMNQLWYDQGASAFTGTQVISVYAGTYTEAVTANTGLVPTASNRLIISANSGDTVIIDGGGTLAYCLNLALPYTDINRLSLRRAVTSDLNLTNCTNSTITGVTFGSSLSADNFGVTLTNCAAPLTMTGCILTNLSNTYSDNNGVKTEVKNSTITACPGTATFAGNFHDNTINSTLSWNGNLTSFYNNILNGNIWFNGVTYANIYNNLVLNHNINIIGSSSNVNFLNNTLRTTGTALLSIASATSNITIRNNIVSGDGVLVKFLTTPSGAVLNNNFYEFRGSAFAAINGTSKTNLSGWQSLTGQEANSASGNPVFVNSSGSTPNDFKLQTSSPAKFVGSTQSGVFTTDYFGTTRDVLWDAGFYESKDVPVVSNITPNYGNVTDPTTVTITGSGFFGSVGSAGGTSASINSVALTLTGAVINDSSITAAIVPVAMSSGTFNVIVTTGMGSNTTSAVQYAVSGNLSSPTIAPAAGTYTGSVTITLSTNTTGATIYYTTDGTTPTVGSNLYSAPFAQTSNATIVAFVHKGGLTDSPTSTSAFTVQAVTPVISPNGGAFTGSIVLTLSTSTSGATVFFTTDGTAPATSSNAYTTPVTLLRSAVINAAAFSGANLPSAVATAAFTNTNQVVTPVVSPNGGAFSGSVVVALSTSTAGATIYYSTDGSSPTTSSNTYTSPFTLLSASMVKAIAYYGAMSPSDVATAVFTAQAAAPVISPAAGTYTDLVTISMTTATGGATIMYTVNGTGLTSYSAPFTASTTETIAAYATNGALADSNITTSIFAIQPQAPVINPAAGAYVNTVTVTMSTGSAGATIMYTVNGTGLTNYTAPVSFTSTAAITAYSANAGMTNSANTTSTFIVMPVPSVTAVSPGTVSNSAPATVAITGTGFFAGGSSSGVTGLRLTNTGGSPATIIVSAYSVASDTQITGAVIPLGFPSASYDVRVTTGGGENTTSVQKLVKTSAGVLGTYSVGAGQAFATIQAAVDQLYFDTAGSFATISTQTITIYPGVYTESVNLSNRGALSPTAGSRLVIAGDSGGTAVTINGVGTGYNGNKSVLQLSAPYVTLSGVVVTASGSTGPTVGVIDANTGAGTGLIINNVTVGWDTGGAYNMVYLQAGSKTATISSSRFICSAGSTNTRGLNMFNDYGTTLVTNCQFSNSVLYANYSTTLTVIGNSFNNFASPNINAVTVNHGGANSAYINGNFVNGAGILALNSLNTPVVCNNLVVNSASGNGAIVISGTGGPGIYNNTIVNPVVGIAATTSTNCTLINNIVYLKSNSTTGIYINSDSLAGAYLDYNLITPIGASETLWSWNGTGYSAYAAYQAVNPTDTHSLTVDPLFANASGSTANDFKLQSSSPAKFTGSNLSAIFTADYFNSTRIPLWDMGFYESSDLPSVSNITPAIAAYNTVTTVTITGSGFFGTTGSNSVTFVKFDDSGTTALTITSATITDSTITGAVIPGGINSGSYNVKVTTSFGTNATSAVKFVVMPVPVITSVTPNTGTNAAPATISIIGSGFMAGTGSSQVTLIQAEKTASVFVTMVMSSYSVVSDTLITGAVFPLGTPTSATYNIRVYSAGGANVTNAGAVFTRTGTGLQNTYNVGAGKPFTTIQSAINQLYYDLNSTGASILTSPQTITIQPGIYNESLTFKPANNSFSATASNNLVVTGDSGGTSVTINGNGTGLNGGQSVIKFDSPYTTLSSVVVTISGAVVSRGLADPSGSGTVSSNVTINNVTFATDTASSYSLYFPASTYISNCKFICSASSAAQNFAIYFNGGGETGPVTITNCQFINSCMYGNVGAYPRTIAANTFTGYVTTRNNSIYITTANNAPLYIFNNFMGDYAKIAAVNCTNTANIYNNLSKNWSDNGAGYGAIELYGAVGANVYNNTIINPSIGIGLIGGCSNVTIKNNLIYFTSSGHGGIYAPAGSTTGVLQDYNCVAQSAGPNNLWNWNGTYYQTYTTYASANPSDAHSITLDPLLVNPGGSAAADFKFAANSPAKFAGTDGSALFTTDYFGTARTALWDIGFYESADLPVVSNITPSSGYSAGGQTVTITGYGFFGGTGSPSVTAIKFDDSGNTAFTITGITVTADTQIVGAVTPGNVASGNYNVKVSTGLGANTTSAVKFTVIGVPVIISITPGTGTNTAPSTLSIIGSGFFAGTGSSAVTLIEAEKTTSTYTTAIMSSYSVVNDTLITGAIFPLGFNANGSIYNIRVFNTQGASVTSSSARFTKTGTGGQTIYNVGSGQPFTTIQSAINQLYYDFGSTGIITSTQIISVQPGTYSEGLWTTSHDSLNNTSGSYISAVAPYQVLLTGDSSGTSVTIDGTLKYIDPTYNSVIRQSGVNWTFKNLVIQNLAANAGNYGMIDCNTGNAGMGMVVDTCTFITTITGIPAIFYPSKGTTVITNCRFYCNAGTGAQNNGVALYTALAGCTVSIINCTFRDSCVSTGQYAGTAIIDGNTFTSTVTGSGYYALYSTTTTNLVFRNNFVKDNYLSFSSGSARNPQIYNNLFLNEHVSSGGIIANSGAIGMNVYNNTFIDPGVNAAISASAGSTSLTAVNNIFYLKIAGAVGIKILGTTNSFTSNNCVYKASTGSYGTWGGTSCTDLTNWTAANAGDTGSINTNPLFVNVNGTTATDFKLQASSPAKFAAADLSATGLTNDYFGATRDVAWDMGFYESHDSPVVSTVTPSTGSSGGNTTITITGTGFLGSTGSASGTSASINGTALTLSTAVINDTSIAGAIVPSGISQGSYDVLVTTNVGPSTSTVKFTVLGIVATPSITPAAGTYTGAITVTMTTSTGNATIKYTTDGTTPITSSSIYSGPFTYTNAGIVTIKAFAQAAGLADSATQTQVFTINAAAPVVTALSQSTGSNLAAVTITVTGANFWGGAGSSTVTAVMLGTHSLAPIAASNDSTIPGVIIPSGLSIGTYDITVATLGGTSTTSVTDQYTVTTPLPTISSLSTNTGSNLAAVTISVTGTGFFGGLTSNTVTAVKLGTLSLTYTAPVNDSVITGVIIPSGLALGTYDITVTALGGTSVTSSADKYAVTTPAPVVSSVSPNSASGATPVTVSVTGSGFFGGLGSSTVSAVMLGTQSISYTVANDTSLGAVIPAGLTGGTYDITVTALGGTSSVTPADKYEVQSVISITLTDTSSLAYTIWGMGTKNLGTATTMTSAQGIHLVNSSNIVTKLNGTANGAANWTVDAAPGIDKYKLELKSFTAQQAAPDLSTGATVVTNTDVFETNIPAGTDRWIYGKFSMPTASSTAATQHINVTITATVP